MSAETWLPVPDYEGLYEASDQGRIRSLDHEVQSRGGTRMVRGRVLRPRIREDGYLQVCLYQSGQNQRYILVHAVEAATHIGPRPAGFDVCHGNGVKSDNRVENLRYDSHAENQRDQVRHGTHACAQATHCKRGHEFTDANTLRRNGGRTCRTCKRNRREAA